MKELMENFRRYTNTINESLHKGKRYALCSKQDVNEGTCEKVFHTNVGSDVPVEIIDEKESKEDGKKYYSLKFIKDGKDHTTWVLASKIDGALKPFTEKEKPAPQSKKEKDSKQKSHKKEQN